MLPANTILKISNQVLYWKNSTFWFTQVEAEALYEAISRILADPLVTRMIIDNRDATGSFSDSVEAMWDDLLLKLSNHFDICATLENSMTAAMMNQISKGSGVLHKVRSFVDVEKAMAFVGISDKNFLSNI